MIFLAVLLALGPQEEAVRKLIDQLSSDNIEFRSEAFRKLEAIGPVAIPFLEKAALDSDGEVSSRAKTLLVRIPIRQYLTPSLSERVPGIYERLAQGEWKEVFLEVASDLRLPQERRRYPGVRAEDLAPLAPKAVRQAGSETEKILVCEAVGRCRLKSAMPDVVRLLQDEKFTVRANAAAAIRDAGAKDLGDHLRSLLADPAPVVRSVAAHGLARLGAKEAIPQLVALLGDPSSDVRWWSIRALGDLGAREALGKMEELRNDVNPAVRRAAEETAEALRRKP
jgi:HEAT repeat protein